jgi:hypothetical protein
LTICEIGMARKKGSKRPLKPETIRLAKVVTEPLPAWTQKEWDTWRAAMINQAAIYRER